MIKTYLYNHDEHLMYHDVDLFEKDELLENPNNLLWIDMYNCTEYELNYIGELFDFHPLAMEDCLQKSPRAKVDEYDDYHFFVLHAIRYDEDASEDEISSIELDVFLGSNYIVTIHTVPLNSVGTVARVCRENVDFMEHGAEHLLYNLIDKIVDELFPILESIGDRIDEVEDNIFVYHGTEVTEEILALKQTLILIRKVLIPQRNIFSNIRGRYSFFIQDENVPYFLDLADHLNSLLDMVNTYRDLINSAFEIYHSVISERTSDIITILTVISIIMMPFTVITGFFGMNVPIPGQNNPLMILGITLGMLVLAVWMIVYFKHRKWI